MPPLFKSPPLPALPAPYVEALRQFHTSSEVMALLAFADLWDGKSVRGDLLSLTLAYHNYFCAVENRGEIPRISEIQVSRMTLIISCCEHVFMGDQNVLAFTRAIWAPLRKILWSKQIDKCASHAQREAELGNHWWWVAMDRRGWGIQIMPLAPFRAPLAFRAKFDHSDPLGTERGPLRTRASYYYPR